MHYNRHMGLMVVNGADNWNSKLEFVTVLKKLTNKTKLNLWVCHAPGGHALTGHGTSNNGPHDGFS